MSETNDTQQAAPPRDGLSEFRAVAELVMRKCGPIVRAWNAEQSVPHPLTKTVEAASMALHRWPASLPTADQQTPLRDEPQKATRDDD